MLDRADGPDVGEHGGVLQPMISSFLIRVVVESHGLGRDGVVEAAQLALHVSRIFVGAGPVQELLGVAGYLTLSGRT